MVSSASHSDYSELEITEFDTNTVDGASDSLYINGNRAIGVYVHDHSGAHTNHVLTIQISADGSNWFSTAYTVTGCGYIEVDTIAQYIRVKVTTAEGAASECNIFLTSK